MRRPPPIGNWSLTRDVPVPEELSPHLAKIGMYVDDEVVLRGFFVDVNIRMNQCSDLATVLHSESLYTTLKTQAQRFCSSVGFRLIDPETAQREMNLARKTYWSPQLPPTHEDVTSGWLAQKISTRYQMKHLLNYQRFIKVRCLGPDQPRP